MFFVYIPTSNLKRVHDCLSLFLRQFSESLKVCVFVYVFQMCTVRGDMYSTVGLFFPTTEKLCIPCG